MKYVQRFTDRHGHERLYFRKRGYPSRPLTSAWGTPDLQAEVDAILMLEASTRARPGTLKAACRAYELENPNFAALQESTKVNYRKMLYEMSDEFGALRLADFTPKRILQLRDHWAARGHAAANHRKQLLKNVLLPSIIEANKGDPFAMIGKLRRPKSLKEPNPIWPDPVTRTVLEAAVAQGKWGLARAIALARWAGVRRRDLIRLTSRHRYEGRLQFITGKRRVPVDIPEDPELTAWLARTPDRAPQTPRQGCKVKAGSATKLQPLRLVYTLAGGAYTTSGLYNELKKLVVELALRQAIDGAILNDDGDVVGSQYTLHGLRHTLGVELALAGCTDAQGAAILGHDNPISFTRYRRQADRIRLADDAAEKVLAQRERLANEAVSTLGSNLCQPEPLKGAS